MDETTGGYEFRCVRCSYDLRGVAVNALCPECGTPVAVSMRGASAVPTSGKAIASMVLGILGVVSCGGYGVSIVLGVIALVLGRQANEQVRRGEAGAGSKGMATAGIVCGWVGLGLGVLTLAFLAFLLAGSTFP